MSTKKSFLNNSKLTVKIASGIIVVATIIAGVYWGYRYLQNKNNTTSSSRPSTQTQTQINKPITKPTLNGRYFGTSNVAQGLSEVNVYISGVNLTGEAIYVGQYNVRIPGLKITGTVVDNSTPNQSRGNINGTFSGSGTVLGQKVTVNGTFSGHIINTSMNVSYSAVTNYGTYPGQITLSKQQ